MCDKFIGRIFFVTIDKLYNYSLCLYNIHLIIYNVNIHCRMIIVRVKYGCGTTAIWFSYNCSMNTITTIITYSYTTIVLQSLHP